MSKNKRNLDGIVYSTDPGFVPQMEGIHGTRNAGARRSTARIRLDTKQRAGKAVTLVDGFTGLSTDLEELGKKLRNHLRGRRIGKDGHDTGSGRPPVTKVLQWLHKNGYAKKSYMIFRVLGPVDSSQC